MVSQLGGRSIPYWSRRIFPAAAAIWILLAVIDRKVGTHTPRSINFVLVGVALLTFPAGVAELKRYGDRRAWLSWGLLLAFVVIVALLKYAVKD